MLASHRLRHALLGAAACLGVGLLAPVAAAQTPPSAPPGAPGPGPAPPGAAPAAGPPQAAPPYGYPPPGPWMSPAEVPPGYAQPAPGGYYPMPYVMPRQDSYQLPAPPPRRRQDMGLFVGGIVMVGGGIVAVIAGAALVSSATNRIDIYCDMPSFPCAHKDDATRKSGGVALMAIGAVAGAAGIPMWIVGSKMVLIPREEKRPALVPELRVGVGSASVAVSF